MALHYLYSSWGTLHTVLGAKIYIWVMSFQIKVWILCMSIGSHCSSMGKTGNGHTALILSNMRLRGSAEDILKLSMKMLDEERFHLIGEKVYYVAQGILIEYPWCGYYHSQRSSLCLGKAGWWGHTKVKKISQMKRTTLLVWLNRWQLQDHKAHEGETMSTQPPLHPQCLAWDQRHRECLLPFE